MSITLIDQSDRRFTINAWNWGILHHLVAAAAVIPSADWSTKRTSGGGSLAPASVTALADYLQHRLLPLLRPGERLFVDGSVTSDPDDGTFYRDEREMWRNYSLRHEVLTAIIAFLRSADGSVQFS